MNTSSTDVVLYNPAKIPITVTLTLPKRDFFFCHRKITIKQKWEPGGINALKQLSASYLLYYFSVYTIGKGGTEIGFGASVYDSSIVMSEFLQEPVDNNGDNNSSSSSIVAGKSVLELGCGPGLNSIAASLARAAFVYCSDGDDASVALACENFVENIRSEGKESTYALHLMYNCIIM